MEKKWKRNFKCILYEFISYKNYGKKDEDIRTFIKVSTSYRFKIFSASVKQMNIYFKISKAGEEQN